MTIEGSRMRREQGTTAAGPIRQDGGEGVATGIEWTRGRGQKRMDGGSWGGGGKERWIVEGEAEVGRNTRPRKVGSARPLDQEHAVGKYRPSLYFVGSIYWGNPKEA